MELDASTNAVHFVKYLVNVITSLDFVKKDAYMDGMETIVWSVRYIVDKIYSIKKEMVRNVIV